LLAGSPDAAASAQLPPEELSRRRTYHQQHPELARQRAADRLTPRELRAQLVQFYADRGRQQIDTRFFVEPPKDVSLQD
jgi:hypothetical protein